MHYCTVVCYHEIILQPCHPHQRIVVMHACGGCQSKGNVILLLWQHVLNNGFVIVLFVNLYYAALIVVTFDVQ